MGSMHSPQKIRSGADASKDSVTRRSRPIAAVQFLTDPVAQLQQTGHSSIAQRFRKLKVGCADGAAVFASSIYVGFYCSWIVQRGRVNVTGTVPPASTKPNSCRSARGLLARIALGRPMHGDADGVVG